MKKLSTIFGMMTLSAGAFGQNIVFTDATGPKNHVGIDTVYGTVLASVPPTPDAQLALWDCSAMILDNYEYHSVFAAETGIGKATHSNLAYVDIMPGMKFQTKYMYAVETDGIKIYGERLAKQTFSLTSETGGPNDKIVILAQDITYSSPQIQLAYHAEIGKKWNSVSRSVTKMEVTYLPFYNNKPAERRTIITSDNEVVGYGKLKIRRSDGKPSGTKPVLLVKTTLNFKDSFFVDGSALPQAALDQMGLEQGQNTTLYQKSFYREYEMLPMMNTTYTDATFTTRRDVNVHTQRLPYPDGINDVDGGVMAEIFPNPNNGAFAVKVSATTGKWTYTVADMTGKIVANGNLNFNGTQATVSLNNTVTAGNYVVTIQQNNEAVSGLKMTIQ